MNLDLNNKLAVVIGGGGHLCSEMAFALGNAGCKIIVGDIRLQKAVDVCQKLREKSIDAQPLEIDASKKSSQINALNEIRNNNEKIDVLINGSGTNSSKPFLEIEPFEWDSVFDTQIKATFLGCQVFGGHMTKQKHGSIINISSASAGPPLSKAFAYSAAKAGIKNLTQNLAREWAPFNVRVNAIRPGFFPTEWNLKNFIDDERKAKILSHTPMARFGKPNELSGAILLLASGQSSFITGSEICVDGGFSCMTI